MAIGKSGEKANRDEIKIYIGEELVTSERDGRQKLFRKKSN